MKRSAKLISLIIAVILALSMLSACGGPSKGNDVIGKYLCTSATIEGYELGADGEWISLEKGGKGSIYSGMELGLTWKLAGEALTVETKLLSSTYTGTLKDGVITLDMGGTIFTFVKEGSNAPGQEVNTQNTQGNQGTPSAQGDVFDAGKVRVLVPDGWYAIPQSDPFSSDPSVTLPNAVSICKGGSTNDDLWTKPYIRIDYYGPGSTLSSNRDFYDDTEDVEPMQCGPYTWEGFITSDYGLMAVLMAEDGEHQYQASIALESAAGSISLDDADVQAILAGVEPSEGRTVTTGTPSGGVSGGNTDTPSGGTAVETNEYAWWDGSWYGWWAIRNGSGMFEDASSKNMCWDIYAEIEANADGTGSLVMWDSGTSKDSPLISCDGLTFEPGASEHGNMYSENVVVFPAGEWNRGWVAAPGTAYFGWTVDPEYSTVSHFDQMIEIIGYYESPENPADAFSYFIYMKPWGETWDDVRDGNTEGCLYKDMMPIHYPDWYLPLLDKGCEQPPATYDEGKEIIAGNISVGNSSATQSGGAALAAGEPSSSGDGKLASMEELYTLTKWLSDMDYDYRMEKCTYDFVVDYIGVEGEDNGNKSGDHYFKWKYDGCYIYVGFHDNGDGKWVRWNFNTSGFGFDQIPSSITVTYE